MDTKRLELWREIFSQLRRWAWAHLSPDDIGKRLLAVWNCFDKTRNQFCALGIFNLTSGRFLLVRAWYDKPYDELNNKMLGRLSHIPYFRISKARNNQGDALLEFSKLLSKQEREWLNLHLYLIRRSAYRD
ncbi:MAG: hypothetical protein A3C71_00195 [Candidatus Yanofskybacteria bacterium RIFCSPHIGHO2_02_FULL_43_15c]|uniref:Uncharacterized protein n=2 Tax=Candidatus Yanofskyibacteriota TaxID=1752733 RepID=A0A1F8H1H9_9BACT|nr:MAG: hypothetical protein A3C71_00195 [Candidatus Yanofskybacteria bacterium RIFCSPHIGHO2_02_FULL_43_15c]OGN31497.1 MAG: hypothetical protein A3I92_01850 [Candidatus Yanofskybacteria bacterium RIFCSPLOWO2_02_FULL_43_10b]